MRLILKNELPGRGYIFLYINTYRKPPNRWRTPSYNNSMWSCGLRLPFFFSTFFFPLSSLKKNCRVSRLSEIKQKTPRRWAAGVCSPQGRSVILDGARLCHGVPRLFFTCFFFRPIANLLCKIALHSSSWFLRTY